MRISLASLGADGLLSANIAGQLTRIMSMEIPQGQFFALDHTRPQIVRLAAFEETTGRAITAAERTANAFDAAALRDQPVQPKAGYIPSWPSEDGYTFKVFIRLRDATLGPGPWTRARINAVAWATRVLTIALPATLVNHAGATHSVVAGNLLDVRISYINSSGHLIWRRETPENATTSAARTVWDVSTYILGVRDQFHAAGQLLFDRVVIWVPQQCLWRWYLNAPVGWDRDPVLGATQIEINANMIDMTRAQAAWMSAMAARGLIPRYQSLYALFLAQLAGIEPDAYPA